MLVQERQRARRGGPRYGRQSQESRVFVVFISSEQRQAWPATRVRPCIHVTLHRNRPAGVHRPHVIIPPTPCSSVDGSSARTWTDADSHLACSDRAAAAVKARLPLGGGLRLPAPVWLVKGLASSLARYVRARFPQPTIAPP